jgi:hypothetical protein
LLFAKSGSAAMLPQQEKYNSLAVASRRVRYR